MKTKTIYKWMRTTIILGAFGGVLLSCEKIDEVPPRTENSVSRSYKMPEPVPLTVDELNVIEQIRKEYKDNIN